MKDTRDYRRSLLDGAGFAANIIIRRILSEYPRLLDYNGLLVSIDPKKSDDLLITNEIQLGLIQKLSIFQGSSGIQSYFFQG